MPVTPGPTIQARELTSRVTVVFAIACGLSVANIYYAQPLIGLIAPALGMPAGQAGLIMTLTQLGYGAGLLFIVPLADVLENRRLVVRLLAGVILGLTGIAFARSSMAFLGASFLVGVCAVATQVLVPFASHLAPEASRGRVVGNVMSGLLAGIMLARPLASFGAAHFGWRAVFAGSAVAMVPLLVTLRRRLPERRPPGDHSYKRIVHSMIGLARRTPVLRRRALYQGMLFAAFNVFWTGVPLLLMNAFGLSQNGIALFALAGAAGALSAPWAGRLADRGWTRAATGASMGAVALAFAVAAYAAAIHSLALLVFAALVLDAAVQICQVLSLREIYMLAPEHRSRLNGLYMATVFVGGSIGSGLAAAIYVSSGWGILSLVGAIFAMVALLAFGTELVRRGSWRG